MKYLNVILPLLSILPSSAQARSIVASEIVFTDARIFEPLKATNVSAGFARIANNSNEEVHLKVRSAEFFATVEMHESYEDHGRSAMREIGEVAIPAHGTFELKPGQYHMMLFDPTKPLKSNDQVKIHFLANETDIEKPFKVIARPSMTASAPKAN